MYVVTQTWVPNRILVIGAGIEDFLFCFLSGGLAWMSTLIVMQKKILVRFKFTSILKRFLFIQTFGIVVTATLYLLDLRDYLNFFIVMVMWSGAILVYKRKYWHFFVIGSLSYLIIFGVGFLIVLLIWPDILSLWNLESFSGIRFLRIPIEELVWAFLYGGTWSLTIAFLLDARLHKE